MVASDCTSHHYSIEPGVMTTFQLIDPNKASSSVDAVLRATNSTRALDSRLDTPQLYGFFAT